MNKHPAGIVSPLFGNLQRLACPVFATSVLYRVIAFVLFAPLVSALARQFLNWSGRVVVSNDEIASFVLQPLGIAALIVMGSVGLSLFALEQACLMTLFYQSEQKALWQAMVSLKRVLGKSPAILELSGRIVVQMLINAAPFLALALLFYLFFLNEHDIIFYLTRQPLVFKHLPQALITKKPANGNRHQQLAFIPAIGLVFQPVEISGDIPAAQSLHVTPNSLFNPFSDFAVAGPGISQVIYEFSKLGIVHGNGLIPF